MLPGHKFKVLSYFFVLESMLSLAVLKLPSDGDGLHLVVRDGVHLHDELNHLLLPA